MRLPIALSLLSLSLFACGPRGHDDGDDHGDDHGGGHRPGHGGPADAGAPAEVPKVDGVYVPGPISVPQEEAWALPALQESVAAFELVMPEATLEAFKADVYLEEQDAEFRYGGVRMPVKVRLRGASARFFDKKSWKVDFGEGRFMGRKKLNLVAEYQDSTMMAEKLAYDLLLGMGVKAPRTQYVRLSVNGRYEGVFLEIEQIDKRFLEAHRFADEDASIYRCGWKDCEFKTWKVPYQGDWNKRTNEDTGRADLDAFLEAVNHTPEATFPEELEKIFDVESYLRSMTMDALMSNNYVEDSESFVVHDQVSGKWVYVPWDLNNVDARFWPTYPLGDKPIVKHPLWSFTAFDGIVQNRYDHRGPMYEGYLPVYSNLGTRMALHERLRPRLLANLDRALTELFTEETMHARIEAMHALIAPYAKDDPWIDQAKFEGGLPYLKAFVSGRIPVLKAQRDRFLQPLGVVLEEVNPALQTVTVRNRGAAPVELSTLFLSTNLREPKKAALPQGSLGSGESRTYAASELGLTLAEKGELSLSGGATVVDFRDLLFYGPAGTQNVHRRAESGSWTVE